MLAGKLDLTRGAIGRYRILPRLSIVVFLIRSTTTSIFTQLPDFLATSLRGHFPDRCGRLVASFCFVFSYCYDFGYFPLLSLRLRYSQFVCPRWLSQESKHLSWRSPPSQHTRISKPVRVPFYRRSASNSSRFLFDKRFTARQTSSSSQRRAALVIMEPLTNKVRRNP